MLIISCLVFFFLSFGFLAWGFPPCYGRRKVEYVEKFG